MSGAWHPNITACIVLLVVLIAMFIPLPRRWFS